MRDRQVRGRVRLGVLWRGPRGAMRPAEDRGLRDLFDELAALGAEVVPVPFSDDRVDAVRSELTALDGLLVWVNPLQDGATRANVDLLLRELGARGVFVSAAPEVVVRMGTKEVLYTTRHLGWGSDVEIYRSVEDLERVFPSRLARHGRLVVKQGRGNGGDGVHRVDLVQGGGLPDRGSPVRVQDARAGDGSSEEMVLGEFLDRCAGYFDWSGFLVDQEYQSRLADGMVRCYLSHDRVVGFCHQWPRGLLDAPDAARPVPPRVMEGPGTPRYQPLRALVEGDWVPGMVRELGLGTSQLPVIWDADFLHGPPGPSGAATWVLCEVNVSAVWPFPPMATGTVARNALARASQARGPAV